MIRVLLAEDQLMVRGALAALLRLEMDIEVVAEAARGDEVVPIALQARPDVAIQKLGARNRMEAARLAEQKGWL